MTEQELIEAFKDGDINALEQIIDIYKAGLYGFLLKLTGKQDVAEDIFQEVFIKFVKNPRAYSERDKFKSWLYTVARNAAMDYFRREKIKNEMQIVVEDGSDGESRIAATLGVSANDTPEKIYENKILSEKIDLALTKLSVEQRETFYMRHYGQLSFKEIADVLNVPIGTVLARMSRSAALLRKELGKEIHVQ